MLLCKWLINVPIKCLIDSVIYGRHVCLPLLTRLNYPVLLSTATEWGRSLLLQPVTEGDRTCCGLTFSYSLVSISIYSPFTLTYTHHVKYSCRPAKCTNTIIYFSGAFDRADRAVGGSTNLVPACHVPLIGF